MIWLSWWWLPREMTRIRARITEEERAEHFEAVMTNLLRYLRPILVGSGLIVIAAGVWELAS